MLVSLAALLLAAWAWAGYNPAAGLAYVERAAWVPSLGLEYHLGLDGLNAALLTLNPLLALVALAGSFEKAESRGYTALLLVAQGAVAGALSALDLSLFFVFWEAMLLPVVLLVAVYGGSGAPRAAFRFFLYTTAGSLLMLAAVIALPFFAEHQGPPLDIGSLALSRIPEGAQFWLLAGFALAFAIKMPLFPLHTWLPALYEAAPLPALAFTTMLVKVGAYGFVRIVLPLFPEAARETAPVFAALSIVGIIYAGALAATSNDLVRVLAYSSVAHLGFIGLGIWSLTPDGIQGALAQMVNHGLIAGALFLLAAALHRRTGTLELARLGGLAGRWPVLSWLVLLVTLASLGLPGLNSFVGEFLVLFGAFKAHPVYLAALLGVLIAAVYSLRYYRLIFHGTGSDAQTHARDLRPAELWPLGVLAALIVAVGVYPRPLLGTSENAARRALDRPQEEAVVERVWSGMWR